MTETEDRDIGQEILDGLRQLSGSEADRLSQEFRAPTRDEDTPHAKVTR